MSIEFRKTELVSALQFMLERGYVTMEEIFSCLEMYRLAPGHQYFDEETEILEWGDSIEDLLGFLTTIAIQSNGNCRFITEDHQDGSGEATMTFDYRIIK